MYFEIFYEGEGMVVISWGYKTFLLRKNMSDTHSGLFNALIHACKETLISKKITCSPVKIFDLSLSK